jgi:uncharacterized MAPEG superfamily protein
MAAIAMSEVFIPYTSALQGLVLPAVLFLVQLLVADVAGMRSKHTPGTPVVGGHDDFLFRAVRAHANTNESLAAFILAAFAAIALAVDPVWVGRLVWGFALARGLHMAAYYADQRNLRSGAFVVGLVCMIGLIVLDAIACCGCG